MDPPREEFDHVYQCMRINGILFPQPLNSMPMSPSPTPPSSPRRNEEAASQGDDSHVFESSRKKRDLSASTVTGAKEISLKLFQCQRSREYILQIRQEGTSAVASYILLQPFEDKGGKKKVKVKDAKDNGDWDLVPVTDEICPNTAESKYDLSLEQRIEGKWKIELRRRNNTDKTDCFYFHEKVNKTMRSLYEVATFIVFNIIY